MLESVIQQPVKKLNNKFQYFYIFNYFFKSGD